MVEVAVGGAVVAGIVVATADVETACDEDVESEAAVSWLDLLVRERNATTASTAAAPMPTAIMTYRCRDPDPEVLVGGGTGLARAAATAGSTGLPAAAAAGTPTGGEACGSGT